MHICTLMHTQTILCRELSKTVYSQTTKILNCHSINDYGLYLQCFSYRKFGAPRPPINRFNPPLESKWATIYVTKTFSSFQSSCLLQMMHVYQAQKWIEENISDFCKSTIFYDAFHAATINDTSGCVAFGPNTNHELRLFLSMHKQNIRLAAWDGGQCDGEQRKWTQMLIAILKRRSINLTVESKWLYCPKLPWFVCLMFLSWSMKKNHSN